MKKILSLFATVALMISCSAAFAFAAEETGVRTVFELKNNTGHNCKIISIRAEQYDMNDGSDKIGTVIEAGQGIKIKFKITDRPPVIEASMTLICEGQLIGLQFDKRIKGIYYFIGPEAESTPNHVPVEINYHVLHPPFTSRSFIHFTLLPWKSQEIRSKK